MERFTPQRFTEKEKNDARLLRENIQSKEIDPVFDQAINQNVIDAKKKEFLA